MFDYSKIDLIDPAFLSQYLDPSKDGPEAFLHVNNNCEKIVLYNGKQFTIRFYLLQGLASLWRDYSYELVGRWYNPPKGSLYDTLLRLLIPRWSVQRHEILPDSNCMQTTEELLPLLQKELEKRTYCYDLYEVQTKGVFKLGRDGYNELILPKGLRELTHKQVRQRVLCLIAMAARLEQDSSLKTIMNHAVYKKDGTFAINRIVSIASIGIHLGRPFHSHLEYGTYNLRGKAITSTELEIVLTWEGIAENSIARATDLFDFPLKATTEESSTITELTAAGSTLSLRKKLLYGTHTISYAGQKFTVKNDVHSEMDRITYNQNYDISAAANSYIWQETVISSCMSPEEVERCQKGYNWLQKADRKKREDAFILACYASATQRGMELIVQGMAKDKDGLLVEKQSFPIATMQMKNDRDNTWHIYAVPIGKDSLKIGIKRIKCTDAEIARMRGDSPDAPRDLIDISEEFRQLAKQ